MKLLKRSIGFIILYAIFCALLAAHFDSASFIQIIGMSLIGIVFIVLTVTGMLLMLGEL